MAVSRQPTMSVEEYLRLDRASQEVRYEYIDGYVVMLAGGTANHAIICSNLIRELATALRNGPCRVYTSDMRVRLSERRYVYPDVTVSCDQRDLGTVDSLSFPRLVVEVLSPSTEANDRGRKFDYYRECPTIIEYLLIDSQRRAIQMFRREKNDLWLFRAFDPEQDIELTSIGAHISLAALYEGVLFVPPKTDEPA